MTFKSCQTSSNIMANTFIDGLQLENSHNVYKALDDPWQGGKNDEIRSPIPNEVS